MDRNDNGNAVAVSDLESLSARRAWIEIAQDILTALNNIKSLSARRAWIEIWSAVLTELLILVALRKESVDRNLRHHNLNLPSSPSLSARRAWIEMEGASVGY